MTISSIPSKFETTLTNNRERDGFGIGSHRFIASETDVPGPGRYNVANNDLVRNHKTCGSVSRKGYSTLASKTDRFGFLERQADVDYSRPGPGSYEVVKKPIGSQTSGPVCVYRPEKTSHNEFEPKVPGPGTYNHITSSKSENDKKSRSSSFMVDKIDRFKPSKSVLLPSPGAYNAGVAVDFLFTQGKNPSGNLPMGSFRSGTQRSQFLKPTVSQEDNPGPGTYTFRASTAPTSVRSSSMFSNVNTDRFGVPYRRRSQNGVPGPGWYSTSTSTFNDNNNGSNSNGLPAFRSKGDRFEATQKEKMSRPPGPAFYQAAALPKKNFMLNPRDRWV